MPRYSVSGAVHGSTWIGEYDANTPEEAIERAYNDAGISLCHECARSVSDPEVCELTAEDLETGDATSEATTNDQIVEQAAEIRRLRALADELTRDLNEVTDALGAAHTREAHLRAALDAVMDACDPECYGCGAYYVAKKALDATKEKP